LVGVALAAAVLGACASEVLPPGGSGGGNEGGTPTIGGSAPLGGDGGEGGSTGGMCAQDCSVIDVPPCYEAVCNTETAACEITAQADGEICDDGLFCTDGDSCIGALCVPGDPMICAGKSDDPCLLQECDEDLDVCNETGQVPNGTACISPDTCTSNAICQNGFCLGAPLDCSLAPVPNECHVSQCDPLLGSVCAPIPGNDGQPCDTFGDLCMENKTCLAGDCVGGVPTVCPSNGCNNGVCNPVDGSCGLMPVPPGGNCLEATDACNTGICNASGQCLGSPANNGASCNDGNACTVTDTCGAGLCNGVPDPNYTVYFNETFSSNSQGWTLGPEWAIGSAASSACGSWGADPAADHTVTADNGIAGVILGGCYSTALHADYCITSPVIDASAPGSVVLSYWRHLHSDYPNYISSHVDVSSNSGASWSPVYSVPSGAPQNDAAWTLASFDVTAQKSATMQVRFCYSAGPNSGIIAGGGWNIDDVTLATAPCN